MNRFLALGLILAACAHDQREDRNIALGGDVAARVGDHPIPLSLVARVAEAQQVSPREAARKLVDDEIAAAAARTRGLDRHVPASWLLESARARFAADRFFEEAKRRGPPTDEEVKILSDRHWQEVDCPPSVRVIHAIVLRPKDAALVDRARALARDLHSAVVPAGDADDFEARAKAVPVDKKLEIKVERLPPMTDDGWVTEGDSRMDEVFSRAAAALPHVGDTSGIVETKFGFHVVRLLEQIPEKRMPFETRRLAFTQEAYLLRARTEMNARLKALSGAQPVSISPAAEQLMRMVKVAEAPSP